MRLCYHRHKYDERELDLLDGDQETENVVIGEDPRIFDFRGKTYILDNFANDMHLIEIDAHSGTVLSRVPIHIPAKKNVSPVVKDDQLYFIDFEEQQLFKASLREQAVSAWGGQDIDIIYGTSAECKSNPSRSLRSCFLRGGTPGVKLGNGWVGMGHCTGCNEWNPEDTGSCMGWKGDLTHTTFAWTTHDLKSIRVKPLCLQNSRNVADPTTLWTNPWRLVTAESDDQWMTKSQTYSTVMYKPCGKNAKHNRVASSVTNKSANSDTAMSEEPAWVETLHKGFSTRLQESYQELYQKLEKKTRKEEASETRDE
jgi:hypothetical protein